jgi:hypothetical protein
VLDLPGERLLARLQLDDFESEAIQLLVIAMQNDLNNTILLPSLSSAYFDVGPATDGGPSRLRIDG